MWSKNELMEATRRVTIVDPHGFLDYRTALVEMLMSLPKELLNEFIYESGEGSTVLSFFGEKCLPAIPPKLLEGSYILLVLELLIVGTAEEARKMRPFKDS